MPETLINCKNCGAQFESPRDGQQFCPSCENKQKGDKAPDKKQ